MASSGVRENVNITITPTFDGVCGMLFNIVGREEQNLTRLIKESMYIRVNNPSLNRNIGKYHLPHIWDEFLVHNTELKLK